MTSLQSWLFALLPIFAYCVALAIGLPKILMWQSISVLSPDTISNFRFSNEFLWNYLVAVLMALHLIGVIGIFENGRADLWKPLEKFIRIAAASSFSVYLVHYPALQLLGPALEVRASTLLGDVFLLFLTLMICVLFASIFEWTLSWQRRVLKRFFRKIVAPER